jgi:heat shock protein HslJ
MRYVKNTALRLGVFAVLCAAAACAGQQPARQDGGVSSVMGVEWFLEEIRENGTALVIDRDKLEAGRMNEAFTLRFDENGRVFGTAWPNRYSAPCSWGEDGALAVGTAAATRMLAFQEPDVLKEHEFFDYLGRIRSWALASDGRLELYAAENENGVPAVLVFGKR